MEKEYEETQEADVRPNTVSYVTVSSELIGLLLPSYHTVPLSLILSHIALSLLLPFLRSALTLLSEEMTRTRRTEQKPS